MAGVKTKPTLMRIEWQDNRRGTQDVMLEGEALQLEEDVDAQEILFHSKTHCQYKRNNWTGYMRAYMDDISFHAEAQTSHMYTELVGEQIKGDPPKPEGGNTLLLVHLCQLLHMELCHIFTGSRVGTQPKQTHLVTAEWFFFLFLRKWSNGAAIFYTVMVRC
jgi:hypothetical protein